MMPDTTGLQVPQGAMPVSAEDAPGIAAAAQRLKDRHYDSAPAVPYQAVSYEALLPSAHPGQGDDTPLRRMEFLRFIAEEINPQRVSRGQPEINEGDAFQAFLIINKFIADWRRTSEAFRNEQLSRDLIEAARDSKGG